MIKKVCLALVLWMAGLIVTPFASGQVSHEWEALCTDGWDVAVDKDGNVCVIMAGSGDYTTIKYDAFGNQLWAAYYDGPDHLNDYSFGLAVDSDGNVYVTGQSLTGQSPTGGSTGDIATIKYDASGNELWVARHQNSSTRGVIATDDYGNVYVAGLIQGYVEGGSVDYVTIKYDFAGNELWTAVYDGPAHAFDEAVAIAVDANGNVYVAGYVHNVDTSLDYVTIKYDASGNEVWTTRYDGPVNNYDHPSALAVDISGNVYVTGFSWGIHDNFDYATIKYDAFGNEVWATRYDGPAINKQISAQIPKAIGIDGDGNVYVAGTDDGAGTSTDYLTFKYDPYGNEVWIARYNGPENSGDMLEDMNIDGNGNVYVTGRSSGLSSTGYATVKYDPTGNELWVGRYDYGHAMALTTDDVGNVYVTGTKATIKYSHNTSNTQPGQDVVVELGDCATGTAGGTPVTVTFETVTEGGDTILCTSGTGQSPPSGFKLIPPPTYYEINTTATYTGSIEVCINYGEDRSGEDSLKLFHKKEGQPWQDVTSSLDKQNNIICGTVDSFSVFAIFAPVDDGPAVGGIAEPINKVCLLVPRMTLATLILLTIGIVVFRLVRK